MPTVFSANSSSVLVDGEAIEGLQSLAFRVVTEREDIRAIGSDERIDVSFGLRTVQGEIVVRSASAKLDTLLTERAGFQLVANLSKDKGIHVSDRATTYGFDGCYVEGKSFGIDASGTALATYNFSATRVRVE
jgi:hypothetical protein